MDSSSPFLTRIVFVERPSGLSFFRDHYEPYQLSRKELKMSILRATLQQRYSKEEIEPSTLVDAPAAADDANDVDASLVDPAVDDSQVLAEEIVENAEAAESVAAAQQTLEELVEELGASLQDGGVSDRGLDIATAAANDALETAGEDPLEVASLESVYSRTQRRHRTEIAMESFGARAKELFVKFFEFLAKIFGKVIEFLRNIAGKIRSGLAGLRAKFEEAVKYMENAATYRFAFKIPASTVRMFSLSESMENKVISCSDLTKNGDCLLSRATDLAGAYESITDAILNEKPFPVKDLSLKEVSTLAKDDETPLATEMELHTNVAYVAKFFADSERTLVLSGNLERSSEHCYNALKKFIADMRRDGKVSDVFTPEYRSSCTEVANRLTKEIRRVGQFGQGATGLAHQLVHYMKTHNAV